MKFYQLSKDFFNDYPYDNYSEMMLKDDRPYIQVLTTINGLIFAVPLRSGISHNYDVLWTDKASKCGLDFTKAIPILKSTYISNKRVYVRQKEYQHLLGKERRVQEKMEKCIKNYKKAKTRLDIERNVQYCNFSTLKYFEKYIYTKEELAEVNVAATKE